MFAVNERKRRVRDKGLILVSAELLNKAKNQCSSLSLRILEQMPVMSQGIPSALHGRTTENYVLLGNVFQGDRTFQHMKDQTQMIFAALSVFSCISGKVFDCFFYIESTCCESFQATHY